MRLTVFTLSLLTSTALCGTLKFRQDETTDADVEADEPQPQPAQPEGEYWFDQLIDHNDASLGTFKQRYYFSDKYYAGEGSPIVLVSSTSIEKFAEGEGDDGLKEWLAGALSAAGVVVEHRYWGSSTPYPELTVDNLKYLTIEQASQDLVYFSQNVQLPFVNKTVDTHPNHTAWVNVGLGYSGLLAAFTQQKYGSNFAATWSSSAPVQISGDFWEYWEPIEQGMPRNCSSDISAAVAYIDNLLTTGSAEDVTTLKSKFSLEALENEDFVFELTRPLTKWQELQPTSGATSQPFFYAFCDAVESTGEGQYNTEETGVGLPAALDNWAAALKAWGPEKDCPGTGGSCYSTYDYSAPAYTDLSNNEQYARPWWYLVCTQLGALATANTGNSSTIVSSQLTPAYWNRICSHRFPNADGSPGNFDITSTTESNGPYKGWNIVADSLYVVNGEFDAWRSASVSPNQAPGLVGASTQSVSVIPGGKYGWDYYAGNVGIDEGVKKVREDGAEKLKGWLTAWHDAKSQPSTESATEEPAAEEPAPDATVNTETTTTTSSAEISTVSPTFDFDDDGEKIDIDNDQSAAAESAADQNITNNNTNSTTTDQGTLDKLKAEISDLMSNRTLAIASLALNVILLGAFIAIVVLLTKARRKNRTRNLMNNPAWD
ncbi:Thymus-specific serine protease, partial [Tulasnella sp. 403]